MHLLRNTPRRAMLNLSVRPSHPRVAEHLTKAGIPPLLARLYAARGIQDSQQIRHSLHQLEPFGSLMQIETVATRLADAIARQEKILVVADYDADGATACALATAGLRALGAQVAWLVPNRFDDGYGLTAEIVNQAATHTPQILLTVDNGIAAFEGVAEAKKRGIEVIVTDHHLPGETVPDTLIVNPNQAGCAFPSKNLAGVGVAFYVVMATRAELRKRGAFSRQTEPPLGDLLDLVALGTVADVVKLDDNNRLLVDAGLRRIRAGHGRPGINALFRAAGRDPLRASAQDLGFTIGPRLNAAGRLADMGLGVACLLAPDDATAIPLAHELDRLNRERREIEAEMQAQAATILERLDINAQRMTLTLFDPTWHQGVIGLLASRIKERHHRPTLVFAEAGDGWIKGSGRSVPALHLRDALDQVDRRHPGLIARFGGHAAAAGLTLRRDGLDTFSAAFEAVAHEALSAADLERLIETDGALPPTERHLDNAQLLRHAVWGQGFPPPTFLADFTVQSQRLVGGKHLRLRLAADGQLNEAILFNHDQALPDRIRAVYRMEVNEFNGSTTLQLGIEHWSALS